MTHGKCLNIYCSQNPKSELELWEQRENSLNFIRQPWEVEWYTYFLSISGIIIIDQINYWLHITPFSLPPPSSSEPHCSCALWLLNFFTLSASSHVATGESTVNMYWEVVYAVIRWIFLKKHQGSSPGSTWNQLYNLRWVTYPLWVSDSLSVKWR